MPHKRILRQFRTSNNHFAGNSSNATISSVTKETTSNAVLKVRALETLEGSFRDMSKAVEIINSNGQSWKKREKKRKTMGIAGRL
jgi:hypothetical protein